MYIDYKVTTWMRIDLSDDVTSEEVKEVIEKGGNLSDFEELETYEVNELLECAEEMTVEENGNQPTIEWRDDDKQTIWDNYYGYNQDDHDENDTTPNIQTKPDPIYFLFGLSACAAFNEGMESIQEYIESGEGHGLYIYTGNVIELMSEFNGWDDYVILSEEEYNAISEF